MDGGADDRLLLVPNDPARDAAARIPALLAPGGDTGWFVARPSALLAAAAPPPARRAERQISDGTGVAAEVRPPSFPGARSVPQSGVLGRRLVRTRHRRGARRCRDRRWGPPSPVCSGTGCAAVRHRYGAALVALGLLPGQVLMSVFGSLGLLVWECPVGHRMVLSRRGPHLILVVAVLLTRRGDRSRLHSHGRRRQRWLGRESHLVRRAEAVRKDLRPWERRPLEAYRQMLH